jgi:RimJ/RimL family protein N-acetyltransferase
MQGLHEDQIPREIDPETGLPVGPRLADPGPAKRPERIVLEGRYCRLEPIDPARHRDDQFAALTVPDARRRLRYLSQDPPGSLAEMEAYLANAASRDDPLMFAVIDRRTGKAEGRQTLMRITPEQRTVEIGNIYWGPAISRTPVTTEANFLFATYIFEALGYRRYEWKCDSLNAPSRAAAARFGFTYEGHFRRAAITKGRSRDTIWFGMIDEEWPRLKAAYECWLDPANFDAEGRQRSRLSDLTAAALRSTRAAHE